MFLASPETPDILQSALLPIPDFSTSPQCEERTDGPSFLRGWPFLKFETVSEPGGLPARSVARHDGPTIILNDRCISLPDLENPLLASFWLPMALNHLCTEMLHETDESGLFADSDWQQFRAVACLHGSLNWQEAVDAAEREGVEYVAEALAQALFVESGLHEILDDRCRREGRVLHA